MTQEQKECPIWGDESFSYFFTPSNMEGESESLYSSRAGGQYKISGTAISMMEKWSREAKIKLSRWIWKENLQRGLKANIPLDEVTLGDLQSKAPLWSGPVDDLPFITSDILKAVETRAVPTISDRMESFALHLFNITKGKLGVPVGWTHMIHGEGGRVSVETKYMFEKDVLMAATFCGNEKELYSLAIEMAKGGYLAESKNGKDAFLRLTAHGHELVEKARHKHVASEQGFIAMWIHKDMEDTSDKGLKSGIESAGYKPLRIDWKEHNNKIDDEIMGEIRRSRFVVADLTCCPLGKPVKKKEQAQARGSVYYEAGFAHGLEIPVIFTCHKQCLEHVHFDVSHENIIDWESLGELRKRLANRIGATVGDGPHKRSGQEDAKNA